jgi:hypothetical protein
MGKASASEGMPAFDERYFAGLIGGHGERLRSFRLGRSDGQRHNAGRFGALKDERPAESGFEQVLGCGEAGGRAGGSLELRNVEREDLGRNDWADADAGAEAGLAKGASEAKNAGERKDLALRAGREFLEGAMLALGLRAAVIPEDPSDEVPIIRGPSWRNGKME